MCEELRCQAAAFKARRSVSGCSAHWQKAARFADSTSCPRFRAAVTSARCLERCCTTRRTKTTSIRFMQRWEPRSRAGSLGVLRRTRRGERGVHRRAAPRHQAAVLEDVVDHAQPVHRPIVPLHQIAEAQAGGVVRGLPPTALSLANPRYSSTSRSALPSPGPTGRTTATGSERAAWSGCGTAAARLRLGLMRLDEPDGLHVSSTKAVHGHLLDVAGALEAVIKVLALQQRTLPLPVNCCTPDAALGLNLVLQPGTRAA